MEIESEIREFVIENFLFGSASSLEDTDSFLENGVIDSTGVLELVAFLEQRFSLRLQDHELAPENLDSIQRVSGFVRRRLEEQNGSGHAS